MLYTHFRQNNGLAGSPFTLGGSDAQLSPFNPFGTDITTIKYRLQQELGDRLSTFDKDYWRWVIAVKGDLDFADNPFISHFGYDSGITYERFEEEEIDNGDAQRTLIVDQVLAGVFNPFIGQNAPPVGVAPTYVNGVPTGVSAPYNNIAGAEAAAYLAQSFFRNKTFTWDIT